MSTIVANPAADIWAITYSSAFATAPAPTNPPGNDAQSIASTSNHTRTFFTKIPPILLMRQRIKAPCVSTK